MAKKNQVLLGAITNYGWEVLEPFFVSWKMNCSSNTDCVIYYMNIESSTKQRLRDLGVKLYPIAEEYKYFCVNDYRFILFKEFVDRHHEEYDKIMIADVRDVVFQSDVFSCYSEEKYLGIAIEAIKFRDDPGCNQFWMLKNYGRDFLEKVMDQSVICCGTIWGTSDMMQQFISQMVETMFAKNHFYAPPTDQCTMNFLIYTGAVERKHLLPSYATTGPVMTMGVLRKIRVDPKQGLVLNDNTLPPAVLHQYDRSSDLTKIINNKYTLQNLSNLA